jgi:hypothetical protein
MIKDTSTRKFHAMSDATPRLGLPWLMPAQAQKHVTVNESLGRLDALIQARVASRTTAAEPASPAQGDAFILPAGFSGAHWDGFLEHDIAYFQDGAWARIAARTGLTVWVEDEAGPAFFDGGAWIALTQAITALENLTGLGVGTTPDAGNPFAAKLNAALWTARYAGEGGTGDLRYTLNKEAPGDVLSLLLQSNWSGRAELGLTGSDDLSLRVSADGASWAEALSVARASGVVTLPALGALNGDALGGLRNRMINGDFSIHQRGGSSSGPEVMDRWVRVQSGGVGHAFTQESFDPGQSDVPGAPAHFLRWVMDAVPSDASLEQRIEDVRTFAGQTLTYSFWARASEALTLEARLQQYWGGGSPAASFADTQAHALTTGWTRCTRTLTLPGLSGRTLAAAHYIALRLTVPSASAAPTLEFADVQLESGPAATPFERRPHALELALCQRYLQAKTVRAADGSRHIPLAPMRAAPTLTLGAGTGAHITRDGFELTYTSAADCTVQAHAEL